MERILIPIILALSSLGASARDIQLEELWRRGGETDDLIFGVVARVVEDDGGNLYLLDSQLHEIQVLDRDGEWLRSMGRRGEGPGEFQTPGDLFLGPNELLGIVQVFPGKILQLTTDGDPAPNYPIEVLEVASFNSVSGARGLKDRIVVAGSESQPTSTLDYLRSYGTDGKLIAEFHKETNPFVFGGMKFQERNNRNFTQRWSVAEDGRVAAALDFDAYRIHVWNPDGTVATVIEREFEPITRSADERDLMQRTMEAFTSWNPGSSYEIAPTHMTVGMLSFRDDGSLWVLPADGMWRKPDDCFAEFDVFGADGGFRERVSLKAPGDPTRDGIFFSKDRIYVVTDLLGAAMGAIGSSEGGEAGAESAAPMEIIAYAVTGP